jgi:hemerythrin-like domain-containing protein
MTTQAQVKTPAVSRSRADELPTQTLRDEHVEIRALLRELRGRIDQLGRCSEAALPNFMGSIVETLGGLVDSRIRFADKALFPVIDRHAGAVRFGLTAPMRREHRLIERAVSALRTLAAEALPNALAFSTTAGGLFGLLEAHLDVEENVFFRLLDEAMTRAELTQALRAELAKS